MKSHKLDRAVHHRKQSYIHDDDSTAHHIDQVVVSASNEQSRTPVKDSFQENLRQSCKIYRHLEKIFNKLLDNEDAMSKLQKAFSNIFSEELEYVQSIIKRITASNEPESLKEGIINNLFIFKENLKIFVTLMIENQYEELASSIRMEKLPVVNFNVASEKLPTSMSNFQGRTMEKIDEDDDEEIYERSEKRSDKKPKVLTLSSMYEKSNGQVIRQSEFPSRRTIQVQQMTLNEEKGRQSQPLNQNKSAVFSSSTKHLLASLAKPVPQSIVQMNKKYEKITTKHSMKNLRESS